MTLILGNAPFVITPDDNRLLPAWNTQDTAVGGIGVDATGNADFRSPWWPRSTLLGDDVVDVGMLEADWFEPPETTRGMNTRFGFVGVTRDVYGSILGGCVVKAFRTTTDEKTDQQVSDVTTGAFLVSTPYYPDAHYLVSYKAGSPDVQGSTVNTLIGA